MQTLPKEENVENESDLYWLSHLIMAEEEGASYENKLMCGLVAMNRVKDKYWNYYSIYLVTVFIDLILEVLLRRRLYKKEEKL